MDHYCEYCTSQVRLEETEDMDNNTIYICEYCKNWEPE